MDKSINAKEIFSDFHSDFSNDTKPANCIGFSGKMLIMNLNNAFLNSFQERNAWLAFLENQRSNFGDLITDYIAKPAKSLTRGW